MDRSMDSIGSCSLDVDAESSDISDTSGSLNFPTPISIKDITREFTNNIKERCSVQTVKNTTAYVDPVTGQVCIALTQPTTINNNISGSPLGELHHQQQPSTLLSPQTPEDNYDKKPSYLNLACCVNGYSNITTYDSKIRQDINKSREVSPIRPSSSSLQYCKKSNSLAPPVLLSMPNVNNFATSPQHQQHQQQTHYQMGTNGIYTSTTTTTMTTIGSKYSIIENNNHSQNGLDIHNTSDDGGGGGGAKRSFIQQRVERLYGPGALAQGFYSPKKIKDPSTRFNKSEVTENGSGGGSVGGGATSELARKFQELSPSKDYNQFRKKLSITGSGKPLSLTPNNQTATIADKSKSENNNIDLPCLRHLSQEFRAQLPMVSPKRNFSRTSPGRDTTTTTTTTINTNNIIIPPQLLHATAIITPTTLNGTITTTPPTTTITSPVEQQHHKSQILNSSSSHSTPTPALDLDELDHKVVVVENIPPPTQIISKPSYSSSSSIVDNKILPVIVDSQNTQTPITTETAATITLQQPSSAITTNGSATTTTTTTVKDAHFFLRQLKDEQNRLLNIADEIDKYSDALTSNPDITEDTMGVLRSASGKARLLVSQKMKQFEGLCHNNLNSTPEDQFPTTVDDLQGFWDMVYLQVDHVDALFADIEAMKKNDWKKPEVKPVAILIKTPKVTKAPLASKTTKSSTSITNGASSTAAPSAAAIKREAQRKKLQEMKRRNREALAANNNSSNIPNESNILIAAVDVTNDRNIEQTS